jgi:hypothetical protein
MEFESVSIPPSKMPFIVLMTSKSFPGKSGSLLCSSSPKLSLSSYFHLQGNRVLVSSCTESKNVCIGHWTVMKLGKKHAIRSHSNFILFSIQS